MDRFEQLAWGFVGGLAAWFAAVGFDKQPPPQINAPFAGRFLGGCIRFGMGALVCYTSTGPVTRWVGMESEPGNHGFVALVLGLGSWGLAGWVWGIANDPKALGGFIGRQFGVRVNGSGKHDSVREERREPGS